MRYLRDSDYRYKITENDLTTLVEEDSNPDLFILDAELKAQEQISLFLRNRYDLTALFKLYPSYQNGYNYTTSDAVWYTSGETFNEFIYSPITATTSNPMSGFWNMVEPRYSLIIDWVVTISLFKLHERVSPDNIPTHRLAAYEEVMSFLKMIQQGKLSPDFPEVENRVQNIYIGGSESSGIGFYY